MEEIRIGKYKVLRKIGEGGGGSVYLVEDCALKKMYALKTGGRREIAEEVERMKAITDRRFPYLVDVIDLEELPPDCPDYGSGEADRDHEASSFIGIIMEYVEGPTLEEYIKEHAPLSEQETISLMKQLAGMLGYLHAMRPAVIYRDLKPSNLILQPDGTLRVLDFGAALQGYGRLSAVYSYGTYGYCAPEQRKGKMLTPACDIYACGVIMYYMLTGIDPAKPPYGVFGKMNALTEVSLTVSPVLEDVVNVCCQEEVSKRYADGSVLLDRLNRISTRKEELKDKALMTVYYLVLFAAAAYTGFGICRFCQGSADRLALSVSMLSLCFAAWLMRRLIVEKHIRRHFIKKREWNLLYTEKKTIGLWMFVMVIFLASGCIKKEVPERLPVYLTDQHGRNILIRDGCEYFADGDVHFCLPTEENGYYEIYFYKMNALHGIEKEQIFWIR
ncbi:MAG: serine/threonine protein kinase [Lachnospiraceae bacterium]|nr:serine/threonine protein kinase [Lachnospiraceae bacterium]